MNSTITTNSPKKGVNRLGAMRQVPCPTCHAAIGEYCKSVGLKGKVGGVRMGTSCHMLRIEAAGFTPRHKLPTHSGAKPKSKAKGLSSAKKARQTRAPKRKLLSTPPVLEPTQSVELGLGDLLEDILKEFRDNPKLTKVAKADDRWDITVYRSDVLGNKFEISISREGVGGSTCHGSLLGY